MNRCPRPAPLPRRTLARWPAIQIAAITLGLTTGRCTAPAGWSLDADGERLAAHAADVSSGIEYALAGASLITEIDLAGPGGVAGAQASLAWLMGPCVQSRPLGSLEPTRQGGPESKGGRAVEVSFAAAGCAVPTTFLTFAGSLSGAVVDDKGTLEVRYAKLRVSSFEIDGVMTLVPLSARTFRFSAHGLRVTNGTTIQSLDATGVVGLTTDHALFRAAGTLLGGAQDLYLFEARDVARSFADGCYPNRGHVIVTDASTPRAAPLTAALDFDNDPRGLGTDVSGDARLTYDNHTASLPMPYRDCPGR